MKKIFLFSLFAAFFLQVNAANSATSDWHENQSHGAKTRLVASFYRDQAGEKKLIAAIHFQISDGWKIYGQGSDGIGMPPSIDFTGSKNFSKSEIFWPKAKIEEEKIGAESISYSSYQGEILLPIEIEPQELEQPFELNAQLTYGLCKDVCIPVSESFMLKIPDTEDATILQKIQEFFPRQITAPKSEAKKETKPKAKLALIPAILLAIFGGAILNIMPCVLPVLSIKLLSIIKHSNAQISRIRLAFFATILGIIFCFLALALFACAIKLTGTSLGWGLQFQNPYFLIFLLLVLVFFLGNLLGIFEINFDQFLATILNKKISAGEKKKNIFIPNFLSGILAVLLATPCSAPFLGTAISFALVQNFSAIFLVFFGIGIGFALPYFLLLIAPKLVHCLPKPGAWMQQIKQILAGLLAATLIWLIYVLAGNIGFMPAALAGLLAITLLACFKITSCFPKFLALSALILATFLLPLNLQKQQKISENFYENLWVKFDETELRKQVMQGKVVVVDITANWCLSCKFNKIRVLQDEEIMAKLKGKNIIAMRGDITKPDDQILDFLHRNNRFAIPFNAIYSLKAQNGLLASEFLTKKELLELIEKAQ